MISRLYGIYKKLVRESSKLVDDYMTNYYLCTEYNTILAFLKFSNQIII